MSTYTFSQKILTPIPPEKGSFPLDHEGVCRKLMIKYMRCLIDNKNENTMCRNVIKDYLGCRMDNELMAREDWSNLGFSDEVKET
ncbi:cytochrome c oxidase assembly protein COX19 [Bombus pyrosoma]|uniref:Cytochrome c oxidase assembly protein COX19 n=1 Tax=Bombus impatiens TaxID=132113 RepID=A0A6P6FHM9_BOMIM|nr:cytochrome c oxidase assembly protein COX19 [Bombus impatiens]XP_043589969.1 cytochrome c oxidase assembly protein COX19 [Bombus pyrosoma]